MLFGKDLIDRWKIKRKRGRLFTFKILKNRTFLENLLSFSKNYGNDEDSKTSMFRCSITRLEI